MASKRKSTVPCMITSKSKHMREEIILGCLPELLPTIPEDSILSISGEDRGHFSYDSSRPERGDKWQKGSTYSCPPCRFESRELNYFLDHLHNCHIDFRAQPSFSCLNCGVSVVRFEALALHNAKAHPGVSGGSVSASLHVRKRDGATTVEQSLFTTNGEDSSDTAIFLTKTPIVRVMKAKGEHKKIVVSHTVEVRRTDTGKKMERTDPTMLTNVPELQNGSLSGTGGAAMLRNPEQIKLWFTAQRLKQGISWSPEEIEEARRKMFSTVFQGAAP
uniref:C2H2-type domain-containing protein n=1 Tax=Salmo trutta TaxID=8032 RepID=A0A673Z5D0_SALTR